MELLFEAQLKLKTGKNEKRSGFMLGFTLQIRLNSLSIINRVMLLASIFAEAVKWLKSQTWVVHDISSVFEASTLLWCQAKAMFQENLLQPDSSL